jgi:23S rRNA (uracil1939-C5)-methyltransferase
VEVPHGIPGELVDALVYGKRRRWARIEKIAEPAPDRVPALCAHFHEGCGGCQWQMLEYASQLARKRERVDRELSAAGIGLSLDTLHSMPDPWRYRGTAGLSLGRNVGFRRHGTQSIVAMQDCLISHPLIGQLAAHLNEAVEAERIPNYFGQMGVEARVVDRADGSGLHVAIVPSPGSRDASIDAVLPLAKEMSRLPWIVGIVHRHRQELPELLFGEPFGVQSILGREFAVSGATFAQTNRSMLPGLLEAVLETSSASEEHVVVDVYGGIGLFGLLLAPRVRRVVEIEIDPVGVEAARRSAAMQSLDNVDFLVGTAESTMSAILKADTVIVDPPRAGLTPKVTAAIGKLRPQRILYVSCFARSLARDVVSFAEFGYRADRIRGFDFYPQTYHVELFTALHLPVG